MSLLRFKVFCGYYCTAVFIVALSDRLRGGHRKRSCQRQDLNQDYKSVVLLFNLQCGSCDQCSAGFVVVVHPPPSKKQDTVKLLVKLWVQSVASLCMLGCNDCVNV